MPIPTPTPLGPGIPRFTMPAEYGLWASAPTAIQVWNWWGLAGLVLQVLILIGLVIIGITILDRFLKRNAEADSQS